MRQKITLPPMVHLEKGLYEDQRTYSPIDELDCDLFLNFLRECGVASEAARKCGRGEVAFQAERKRNEDFSAAWEWAEREAADKLLTEARRRAYEGVDEPVFSRGEEIGSIRRYSDSLMIKLLDNLHPLFRKDSDDEGSGRNTSVAEIRLNVIPSEHFVQQTEIVSES